MSLLFGASASDRVALASSASLDNIGAFTILTWIYPTTLTGGRVIFVKGGTTGYKLLRVAGSGGNIELLVDRVTNDTDFLSSGNPLGTLNKWVCIAATFDDAASPKAHLYAGTLTTAVIETGYVVSTAGVGSIVTDASLGGAIGGDVAGTLAFQGREAVVVYCAGALTLGQIIDWQFRPRVIPGTRGLWIPGYNGATNVPDLSGNGNVGTITGATLADHVPLPAPFGRSDGWAPYVVAGAPAAGHPTMRRWGGIPGMTPGVRKLGRSW